jgi:hypothetical protein
MSPVVQCIKNQVRFRYFFHSNDHEPPHVHVIRSGEWEIKVMFLTCDKASLDYKFVIPSNRSKKKKPLSSSEQEEILSAILPRRDQLYDEWCKKVITDKSKL